MRRMLVRALLCAATPPYTAAVVTGSITVSRSLNASVLQLDVKATDAVTQHDSAESAGESTLHC
eukprot:20351-Heterococcus_DN1.PRE.2